MASKSSHARFLANLPINRKGLVVISIPVLALIVSTCFFAYAQWNASVAGSSVRHTLETEKEIYRVIFAILGVQSAARDHATADPRIPQQYLKSKQQLPQFLDALEAHTRDNPAQTSRIKKLRQDILEMIARLNATLDNPPEQPGALSYRQWLEQNKIRMDEITKLVSGMMAEEERLLTFRSLARDRARLISNISIALSLLFGTVGALIAARLFTSAITRRIELLETNANRLQQGLAQEPLPEGYDEIGRLGTVMERAGILLSQRSERLKLAFKAARIVVWEMDPVSGQVQYEGRDEFLESTGYPDELLPFTANAFLELVGPSDRESLRQDFDSLAARDGELRRECRLGVAESGYRWVKITARHYDRRQNFSSVLGVITDVTERKRSEEAASVQTAALLKSEQELREQTRILQCVLNSMGDGVIVADNNGDFLVFNPAAVRIYGKGMVQSEPRDWSRQYGIYATDEVTPYPSSELPLARALRGASVDAEPMYLPYAGGPGGTWVSSTARPLKDENGTIWGGVVVLSNITERRQAERAIHAAKADAENANRAKSEFLSRMSHELRTPLNSILGFAQVLKMQALPERPRECVDHIFKAGTHLLGLIDEVLDIARIEAGRLPLSPEPVLASESVHRALDMVRPLADARNIELTFDRPRSCQQHVTADRQRLQQVLLNLLSNAVKYNHDGGRVDVFCNKNEAGRLRLSVRDTGPGIPAEDQERLFAPFERLSAYQGEIQGTGLGLALSKRLIEAMDGIIGVSSALGQGSTFWIELPCSEAPEDAVRRQDQLSPITIKELPRAHTLLYIEDNLSNMRLMELIVSYRPNIRLIPAMQGRLGLDLAREHSPAMILLDLHLPDLQGDEVLTRLKSDPKTRRIPIVMISADATPGQVSRLLSAGASAYLTKPLDVEKLLKVFDDYLEQDSVDIVGGLVGQQVS